MATQRIAHELQRMNARCVFKRLVPTVCKIGIRGSQLNLNSLDHPTHERTRVKISYSPCDFQHCDQSRTVNPKPSAYNIVINRVAPRRLTLHRYLPYIRRLDRHPPPIPRGDRARHRPPPHHPQGRCLRAKDPQVKSKSAHGAFGSGPPGR